MSTPESPEVVNPPPFGSYGTAPDIARPYAPPAGEAAGVEDQAAAPDGPLGPMDTAGAPELAALDAATAATAAVNGWLTMYDRAQALGVPGQAAPPKTDAVLIYAGGLTPSPWTVADIEAQTARYRLPCWVANGAGSAAGTAEAGEFLAWLKRHGAPRRRLLVLDLETRNTGPDHDYELTFRRTVSAAGYWLALYGSAGNLFSYPSTGGGYFVADPSAVPHMFDHGHVAITQWRFAIPGQDWDLSVMRAEVRPLLWDTHWHAEALTEATHLHDEAGRLLTVLKDYAGA